MVLAISLAISGLPLTTVSAAEQEASISYKSVWANDEISTNVDDDQNDIQKEETVGAVDYSKFNINSVGDVVGNDGITYDDVTYLSINSLLALDEQSQDSYIQLCDVIAGMKDEIDEVVLAVDNNGELYCSYHVPGIVLKETQKDLAEQLVSEVEDITANDETEEVLVAESAELNEQSEEAIVQDSTTEESVRQDLTTEEASEEQTLTEETSEEVVTTEEASKEETTSEEVSEEQTLTEEASEEQTMTEEILMEGISEEEVTTEASTFENIFNYELTGENMDLLFSGNEKCVELPDINTSVELITDLGYDAHEGDRVALYSTLESEAYFSGQLDSQGKILYNGIREGMFEGYNVYKFEGGSTKTIGETVASALSAVVLTNPEKVDWLDPLGGFKLEYNYRGNAIIDGKIIVDSSPFYDPQLDIMANAQVEKLAMEAQRYALENYPNSPAYGVVEYFDKWICENNFYSFAAGVEGIAGPEPYYYCHSAYGALLAGYAVCESYAKAMSRLLDAVEIPNMYVIGDSYDAQTGEFGGHAWNYVQMPDGKWYLLDSTWNNPATDLVGSPDKGYSTQEYLLVKDDNIKGKENHRATGKVYQNQKKSFKFATLSNSDYEASKEGLTFEQGTSVNLLPKESITLTTKNTELNSTYKVWNSSDTKVAKVDKTGKVTAVAPGIAEITLTTTVAGNIELKSSCTVSVYQMKALTSRRTSKANDSISLGITGETGTESEAKTVVLDVNVGDSPYTAQYLVENKFVLKNGKAQVLFTEPKITSSNEGVATATATLAGNQIDVNIVPKSVGKSTIKVEFGGKKVSITATVGQVITEEMFNVKWSDVNNMIITDEGRTIEYTGKAVKPKVEKTDKAVAGIKYKVTYVNNINAGEGHVKIIGIGKFGGELDYKFNITPIDIATATVSPIKAKVYTGGNNPATMTVKVGKKKLAANKDYVVKYNGNVDTNLDAGKYKITIEGTGNYKGIVAAAIPDYEIKQNTFNKVSVSCASKVTYTGGKQNPVSVKIGKNILTEKDYTIKYYKGTDTKKRTQEVDAPSVRGTYFAVVTEKGTNIAASANKREIVKKFTIK